MIWAILLCALGAGISTLVALACNQQYRLFGSSDSHWLEFWLAARIFFTALAVGFLAVTVYVIVLVL